LAASEPTSARSILPATSTTRTRVVSALEAQPVRDVADLRSVRRKRVVAGVINEYHHAA
jgi:hypothetical protein